MDNTKSLSEAIFENTSFLSAYEEGEFWRGNLAKGMIRRLFSWDHINEALLKNRITNDRFRLSLKNNHDTPNKKVFLSTKDGFGRPTDHLLINELHQQLEFGATCIFESIHEIHPDIESLIDFISSKYYLRSAANAYISFGATSGFGVHNDDHDILVCQVEGRKKWKFFGSLTKKYKATVSDIRYPTETDITETLIITEGNILFIPKGTWHDVEAMGEPSLHLTISLVYPSIHSYFDWLLIQNKYETPYQDIKMRSKNFKEIETKCKNFVNTFISEESIANFVKEYYSRYPSIRNHPSFPSLNTPIIQDSYQKIPFSFVDIANDTNQEIRCIIALGKKHYLNPQTYQLFSEMQIGERYSGKQLLEISPQFLDSWLNLASAIKDLLNRGLISKNISNN